jgi:hypothetical protein
MVTPENVAAASREIQQNSALGDSATLLACCHALCARVKALEAKLPPPIPSPAPAAPVTPTAPAPADVV